MREQISPMILGALLSPIVLGSAGCSNANADGPNPIPTQFVIFVDGSASTGPPQAGLWSAAANHLVFERLRPGDALLIFAVSDQTPDAAPLYDQAIPALDPDAGIEEEFRVRKALASTREQGLEAVRRVLLAKVRSQSTYLLDALRRIPRTANRRTEVVFLTDALEASPLVNLERTAITDQNLQRILQSVEDKQRWPRGMLEGVSIQFVLDSPAINERHVNRHADLEKFWRPIFEFVGAKLTWFDSRFEE